MKVVQNQLKAALNPLKPIYIISGDEPLLSEDAFELIRQAAKKQGFLTRERFWVGTKFDWSTLLIHLDNFSLFSDKKLIELHFDQKPTNEAKAILGDYAKTPNDDTVLLVSFPKLDQKTFQTAWFKPLDQIAAVISIWPVDHAELPAWIQSRAKHYRVTLTNEATAALAEQVEGNLLAADQELKRLELLFPDQSVGVDELRSVISDYARYDVFSLVDSCLSQDTTRTNRILSALHAEGFEPILVLWAIAREVRLMIKLAGALKQGESYERLCQANRIWQKRKSLVRDYLTRCQLKNLYRCLDACSELDRSIKGVVKKPVWPGLKDLCLAFSGHSVELSA
jgi:DNA polymerase III subunit delta